jgi:hypothetical protein
MLCPFILRAVQPKLGQVAYGLLKIFVIVSTWLTVAGMVRRRLFKKADEPAERRKTRMLR